MDGQGHDLWASLAYWAFYSVLYLLDYLWQRIRGRGRGGLLGGDGFGDDGDDGGGCGGCGG